ncbi:N-acetylmuramidase family protein [Hydrogenophaga sp.]|uniref:N-acetylmuramidase family protein n=1 Tax=Hydrogenophaga sp. TaxID=1904254 RepID=UPI002FC6AE4C
MALTEQDFARAAFKLGCEIAVVKAVAVVESTGGGFDPEGFPKTLFEGHWFHRETNGKHAAMHPTLSYKNWTRAHYGKTWKEEKARLNAAVALDRTAAMKSASWGMFQIMGGNHAKCGFPTVQEFVNAMCAGEGEQLDAFVQFIMSTGLADALRTRDWARFAKGYNGPSYAKNKYDEKLATAYSKAIPSAISP